MVYHQEPDGRRYDNDRIDTDEGLRVVSAFPRLKRLFLQHGQATDDGLQTLAGLHELEILLVWDADRITDAGVDHLAGLAKLQELHFSNGRLGDASLAVFGRLPGLRHLSLQGNAFSDDGMEHLAGLRHLRSLWIGMNRLPISDAGAQHLAGLTELESLDLQGAHLSDVGLSALKNLTQLPTLYVASEARKDPLTDASVAVLLKMTRLEHLGMQNTCLTEQGAGRLLALPALKELQLSSSAISEEEQSRLQQQRSGLRFYFSRPPRD